MSDMPETDREYPQPFNPPVLLMALAGWLLIGLLIAGVVLVFLAL